MPDRRPLVLAGGSHQEIAAGDALRADGMRSKRFLADTVALTAVAATITPDAATGSVFRHTAAADVTLAKPTNGSDGQAISVLVYASGAARTLTVAGAGQVTIPAGQFYLADLRYDATTDGWLLNDVAGQITGNTSVSSVNGRTGAVTGVAETTDVAARAFALAATAKKTAAYTAAANEFVPADISGGSWTLTLPASPADRTRVAAKIVATAATNTLSIAAGAGAAFNTAGGPTSFTLTLVNHAVIAQYDAATALWYVQSTDVPLSQLDARFAAAAHTHGVDTLTATGTRDGTTFLRGDNTWAVPAGGSGGSSGGGSSGGGGLYPHARPPVGGWFVMAVGTVTQPVRPEGEMSLGHQFLPPGTYDALGVQVATAGSTGAALRVVVYADDGNGKPGSILGEVAGVAATSSGFKTAVLPSAITSPAAGMIVWAGMAPQGAASTRASVWETNAAIAPSAYPSGSTPAMQVNNNMSWLQSNVTGSAPTTGSGFSQNWGHPRMAFRRSA